MKGITVEALKEKTFGPIGSPKRNLYEQELQMEILREEIKKLRKENKLTQAQLGKLIGVQRAHISKMENNAKNITIGTLVKVFNALNAQISFKVETRESELSKA